MKLQDAILRNSENINQTLDLLSQAIDTHSRDRAGE